MESNQKNAPGALPFCGAAASDRGIRRENNEDNYILEGKINPNCAERSQAAFCDGSRDNRWHIAGVFDGMGGGEAGEEAALLCAESFQKYFAIIREVSSREEVDAWVRRAFQEANNRIVELQKSRRVLGSTATVLCADGDVFKIYHLGDSRAYLARGRNLLQLTRDQTLAQMKLDAGLYCPGDSRVEADSHKLTEYVGRDWTEQSLLPVESVWIPIVPGDRILLCSDGLYGMCGDEKIANVFWGAADCCQCVAALVSQAISMGGEDNITCVAAAFC